MYTNEASYYGDIACLKSVFRQSCVPLSGESGSKEGRIAAYVT